MIMPNENNALSEIILQFIILTDKKMFTIEHFGLPAKM